MGSALKPALEAVEKLNEDLAFLGLTNKQEAYCQCRVGGLDMANAYRQAYGTHDTPAYMVYRRAWDLERHSKVVQRMRQLLDQRAADSSLVPTIDRNFVLNGIAGIALNSTKDNVRLRAYELLGKVDYINLFRETKVIEHKDRTITDVDQELKDRLGELAKVFEGEARRVNPDPVDIEGEPAKPAARSTRTTRKDRRRKPAR